VFLRVLRWDANELGDGDETGMCVLFGGCRHGRKSWMVIMLTHSTAPSPSPCSSTNYEGNNFYLLGACLRQKVRWVLRCLSRISLEKKVAVRSVVRFLLRWFTEFFRLGCGGHTRQTRLLIMSPLMISEGMGLPRGGGFPNTCARDNRNGSRHVCLIFTSAQHIFGN